MTYTPVAVEVVRSLVWTNLSWTNISTSVVNRSACIISDVVDREASIPQMTFKRGGISHKYLDQGAEEVIYDVNTHIFMRPSSNKKSTIRNYRKAMGRLVEEVERVIRHNRTNASGYGFTWVDTIVPLDVMDNPAISPPYLETKVRVRCRKIREKLT